MNVEPRLRGIFIGRSWRDDGGTELPRMPGTDRCGPEGSGDFRFMLGVLLKESSGMGPVYGETGAVPGRDR